MRDHQHPLCRSALAVLAALLLLGLPRSVYAGGQAKPGRPNIVFLLADDLRWNALGCMGNPITQTPTVAGRAKRGVLFQSPFATTSICPVSRASTLTGQYARRHRINDFKTDLTPEQFA